MSQNYQIRTKKKFLNALNVKILLIIFVTLNGSKKNKNVFAHTANFNSEFSINHTINIQEPTSSEENDTSSSDECHIDDRLFESEAIYQAVQQIQENRGARRNIRVGESNLELSRFISMICLLFLLIGMFSIILDSRNHIYIFNHTFY